MLSVSTIGVSCDVGRSASSAKEKNDRGATYEIEQCCVFGIDKTEYDEIAKIGKILPKRFTYDAQRYTFCPCALLRYKNIFWIFMKIKQTPKK